MKTVSLADALRSGKRFRYRVSKDVAWIYFMKDFGPAFSVDEILHAECQIIEEPREVWVWQYLSGNLDTRFYIEKAGCEFNGNGWGGRPVKFREVLE